MSNIHNERLKENKMHDVIEELEKKFTIKDLNTILNHITLWLYNNINDKYTDEFVQVDNVALLRSIKKLKGDIVNKKFERYIRKEPDWWHGGSDCKQVGKIKEYIDLIKSYLNLGKTLENLQYR